MLFLREFVQTLDVEKAARKHGFTREEAERKFIKTQKYRERLSKMFEQHTKLFEFVPVGVIRTEVLHILTDRKNLPKDRIAAGKLLTDMLVGVGGEQQRMLGEILAAVETSQAKP